MHDRLKLDDPGFVPALQAGDEQVLAAVVNWYSGSLLRLAMTFVQSRAIAEEVVQETWMGVFESIHQFEGRSLFKTWLFRILTNRANPRSIPESRYETVGLKASTAEAEKGASLEYTLFLADGPGKGN